MNLEKMTSQDMRYANPTRDDYANALETIANLGWEFVRDRRIPFNGWWTHTDHPTQNRPNGDSKNLHLGAWSTLMLYVKK